MNDETELGKAITDFWRAVASMPFHPTRSDIPAGLFLGAVGTWTALDEGLGLLTPAYVALLLAIGVVLRFTLILFARSRST